MNIWANAVITNKGLALQSKLIEGHSLVITRAVTSTGYVQPVILQQQTNISGIKQTLSLKRVSYPEEGKCAVPAFLTNEGLAAGYTASQVGIFAEDPDEGEILYFICQAESGSGTIVPSEAEMPGYHAEWTFYFKYGNADGVSVTVDPAHTISQEEAIALIEDLSVNETEAIALIKENSINKDEVVTLIEENAISENEVKVLIQNNALPLTAPVAYLALEK